MDKKNILILGAPRSGTSLLASLISKHADIAILYEDYRMAHTRIIAKQYVGNKLCLPSQIELKKKRNKFKSMVVNFLLKLKPYSTLFRKFRYPLSYYSVEDYLKLDNIIIVLIVRNGNDVIVSNMERGINVNFDYASYWWRRAIEVMYELWRSYPEKVCLVSFDSLVTNPEKSIRSVSDYIGVKYQPEMLEGYKYTPVYKGQNSIDAGKAHDNDKEEMFNISKLFPDHYEMYIEMVEGAIN